MPLDTLPDDVVHQLLYYVPPDDTLHAFQLTCRRFARLSNEPLLWRFHCRNFKYWNSAHEISTKFRAPAAGVDWKLLFIRRSADNLKASRLFEEILTTTHRRWHRFEQVARLGYDAKEFLLKQCNAGAHLEDVLSRRYYAHALLDSIHRSLAIEEWMKLQKLDAASSVSALERNLAAFDMFVYHKRPDSDPGDISALLESKASGFRVAHPDVEEMSTRQKSLRLNRWLRSENLFGLENPSRDYRNLRNCLIGQALGHEDHESIPIISGAIFSCIARRIGLDAHCCTFPQHVHVVVLAPASETLDGKPKVSPDAPREKMYLDPFGSDDEVDATELENILNRYGFQVDNDTAFGPASTLSIVTRNAANIRATREAYNPDRQLNPPGFTALMHGDDLINLHLCHYASLWATVCLTPPSSLEWLDHMTSLLELFLRHWPEDLWLIDKYIVPLYESAIPLRKRFARHIAAHTDVAWSYVETQRRADMASLTPIVRATYGSGHTPFKIGQIFRHRRYNTIGVITGWEPPKPRIILGADGAAGGGYSTSGTQVNSTGEGSGLPSGLHTELDTFYHYMDTYDPEEHTVSGTSIEIITDARRIEYEAFQYVGKFFKRFDPYSCRFISNMRDIYPED